MTNNSEAFQRIETYFESFRTKIENCRKAPTFNAADWQDAYGRFARLRGRYMKEKPNLDKPERKALSKVFEEDTFTKGMMDIRQVSEHVTKRPPLMIRTKSNTPITLKAESSAMAIFSASAVFVNDTEENPYRLDHLQMLEELERRIATAMTKARG